MQSPTLAIAMIAAVVCTAHRAHGEPDFETARAHYRAAQEAARDGQWEIAAAEYASALELTGDPVLHFRIGDAYEHAGDCQRALDHYERYVQEAAPPEDYAELALRRINACQDEILAAREAEASEAGAGDASEAEKGGDPEDADPKARPAQTAEKPAADAPDGGDGPGDGRFRGDEGAEGDPPGREPIDTAAGAPDEPARDTWHRGAAWTSAGIAVVLAATGGILATSASSREDDLERLMSGRDLETGDPFAFDGRTRDRYDSLLREGRNLQRASRLALGAAGVAAAAAATLFVLDPGRRGPSVAPARPGSGLGVAAGWEF